MKKLNLLRAISMLLFSVFILYGCREEATAIENQNIKTNISHKNFSNFSTNKSLINEINKIKSIATKSKFDKSSQDILNVNLNDALFIEDATNNKHSYIFKIANNSYDIKNLVLANNSSGNYDAYLVNYSLSKEERNLLVSGQDVDMRNKTSITPIDKNKINFNSKTSGTCYELIKYQEDCFCHTTHASGGCTHPDTVYDLIEVPCTGGSTTGDTGTGDQGGTTYGTGSNSTGTGGSYIPNVLITPNGEPIEILANSINSILEMALSGSELLWLNSNTEFAEGIWNMLSNDNSEETKNFAQWGISFAATNNTSWTQFQNWFIEDAPDGFFTEVINYDTKTILDVEILNSPEFKMRKLDQIKYPRFTLLLKTLRSKVEQNPTMLNRLSTLSGLTNAQVLEKLTFGKGPLLISFQT